jgi:hypothetical protein
MEKLGMETKYTFWPIFRVLFHCDTLYGSNEDGIPF